MSDLTLKFDDITFNLKKISESRVLSQYSDSCLYKLLLGVITSEVQELSTAITNLIQSRTIANAKGEQLDAIGRIVGFSRLSYDYDSDYWFAPDEVGVQPDNGHWWVQNYPQAVSTPMDDDTYRKWLWLKVLKNHTKFCAKEEIENQILDGIEENVAIQRTGMDQQDIYVTSSISTTNKNLLSLVKDTTLTDNQYLFGYEAPIEIGNVINPEES